MVTSSLSAFPPTSTLTVPIVAEVQADSTGQSTHPRLDTAAIIGIVLLVSLFVVIAGLNIASRVLRRRRKPLLPMAENPKTNSPPIQPILQRPPPPRRVTVPPQLPSHPEATHLSITRVLFRKPRQITLPDPFRLEYETPDNPFNDTAGRNSLPRPEAEHNRNSNHRTGGLFERILQPSSPPITSPDPFYLEPIAPGPIHILSHKPSLTAEAEKAEKAQIEDRTRQAVDDPDQIDDESPPVPDNQPPPSESDEIDSPGTDLRVLETRNALGRVQQLAAQLERELQDLTGGLPPAQQQEYYLDIRRSFSGSLREIGRDSLDIELVPRRLSQTTTVYTGPPPSYLTNEVTPALFLSFDPLSTQSEGKSFTISDNLPTPTLSPFGAARNQDDKPARADIACSSRFEPTSVHINAVADVLTSSQGQTLTLGSTSTTIISTGVETAVVTTTAADGSQILITTRRSFTHTLTSTVPIVTVVPTGSAETRPTSSSLNTTIIIPAVVIPLLVLIAGLLGCLYCNRLRRRRRSQEQISLEAEVQPETNLQSSLISRLKPQQVTTPNPFRLERRDPTNSDDAEGNQSLEDPFHDINASNTDQRVLEARSALDRVQQMAARLERELHDLSSGLVSTRQPEAGLSDRQRRNGEPLVAGGRIMAPSDDIEVAQRRSSEGRVRPVSSATTAYSSPPPSYNE
ncbi:hypothetical protein NP233_g3266 [Leucocoprinus birnbaumii]|uniref:Transmembrane protein n=1 Tax=Leucocoprinus birnbaumii TaxID=56174 RepID=A0AAD5VZH1_9AGAR|nr:hypothetical protein NP233_g3266 [Leucocoprinus birnbaumii]